MRGWESNLSDAEGLASQLIGPPWKSWLSPAPGVASLASMAGNTILDARLHGGEYKNGGQSGIKTGQPLKSSWLSPAPGVASFAYTAGNTTLDASLHGGEYKNWGHTGIKTGLPLKLSRLSPAPGVASCERKGARFERTRFCSCSCSLRESFEGKRAQMRGG